MSRALVGKSMDNDDAVDDAIKRLKNSDAGTSDAQSTVYVPTGFHVVDYGILKRGGLPDGKIIELFGPTGGCKSILAVMIAAQKQKIDKKRLVYVVDTEYSFDLEFYTRFGLDPERVIIKRTNIAEDAINWAIEGVESGAVCCLIFDSIGNTEGKAYMTSGKKRFEADKKTGATKTDQLGIQSSLTGKMAKRLAHAGYENSCLIIGVNQIRAQINTGGFAPLGDGENRPGGKAWEHNRHVSIRLARIADIKGGDEIIGIESKLSVKRSKISPAGATSEGTHPKFWLDGGTKGRVIEALDASIALGIIAKAGAFLTWDSQATKWRGKNAAMEELSDSASMLEMLEKEVKIVASDNVASAPDQYEEDLNNEEEE